MKTRQGYAQRYNVQAVVSEDQIIVAIGVTQEANDVQQLNLDYPAICRSSIG